MEAKDIISVIAIILGPIIAVQLEKYLERKREIRNRKISIFKTLMATRGATLSFAHVEALNRIDLEFINKKKYNNIIVAWKEYFDNLSQKFDDSNFTIWTSKNEELLSNLLFEMSKSLGYKFDKVIIKRNVYTPVGHVTIEKEQEKIRKSILELLEGERFIPMTFIQDENQLEKQSQLQELMIKYYSKDK